MPGACSAGLVGQNALVDLVKWERHPNGRKVETGVETFEHTEAAPTPLDPIVDFEMRAVPCRQHIVLVGWQLLIDLPRLEAVPRLPGERTSNRTLGLSTDVAPGSMSPQTTITSGSSAASRGRLFMKNVSLNA